MPLLPCVPEIVAFINKDIEPPNWKETSLALLEPLKYTIHKKI